MKKQFENLKIITDRETYDAAMFYMEELIFFATKKGYLSNPENDNKYTREIGRIGIMCADYENASFDFKNLKEKKSIKTLSNELRELTKLKGNVVPFSKEFKEVSARINVINKKLDELCN